MGTCPECGTTVESGEDVAFQDLGAASNFLSFESAKRFYVTECGSCGVVLGTGVAGAA